MAGKVQLIFRTIGSLLHDHGFDVTWRAEAMRSVPNGVSQHTATCLVGERAVGGAFTCQTATFVYMAGSGRGATDREWTVTLNNPNAPTNCAPSVICLPERLR